MRTYMNQRGRLAVLVSAMMITALIAGLIPTALAAGTSTFSDVPASHTCYEDIQWAADNGIVNGYNGKFNSILVGCMAQTQIPTSMGCVLLRNWDL